MTALDAAAVGRWADVIDDHNPLHLDPEYAATTRFGTPVVHGSLLFALVCDAVQEAGAGDDVRVRFHAPVPVGSSVDVVILDGRVRMTAGSVEPLEVELR